MKNLINPRMASSIFSLFLILCLTSASFGQTGPIGARVNCCVQHCCLEQTLTARECMAIGTIVNGACPHGTGCGGRICTQAVNQITESYEGDLAVQNSEVLIIQTGALVKGSIKVTDGILIVRESSFINGNIENENGDLYLNGITITGNIVAKGNNSGSATIINSDVRGEIYLVSLNAARVEDNIIGGNVHSENNAFVSFKDNIVDVVDGN